MLAIDERTVNDGVMHRWLSPPRLSALFVLWILWWCAILALIVGIQLYARWDTPHPLSIMRWPTNTDLLLITGSTGLIVGGIHFTVLKKGLWQRRRRMVCTSLGIVGTLILASVLCLAMLARQNQYQSAALFGLYRQDQYERHAMNGQLDVMVSKMEEDCAYFNRAKQKLGGNIRVHSCNHGFSYLFVEMYPVWDSVIQLASTPVLATLEHARFDGSNKPSKGGYGPWRPFAERVRQSDTPILRALAAFMLEDMDGFAEAAYPLADLDTDAIPLAAFASLRDPVPARSLARILQYYPLGVYEGIIGADELNSLLQNRTIQMLESGQVNESLKAKLRLQPWIRQLPHEQQRMLGLNDDE